MSNKNKIATFIKREKHDLMFLLLLLVSFIAYGLMNRDWGNARNLIIALDNQIPLIPASVFVYHLWAPTLFLVLLYLFVHARRAYRAMLVSIFVAAILAFTMFYFFTSTVVRPEINPTTLATQILHLTYQIDAPFACFPSYHVLTISIAAYFFLKFGKTPPQKPLFLVWTGLICLSTLLTKQHVILDLIGGLIYTYPSVIIGSKFEKYLASRLALDQQ